MQCARFVQASTTTVGQLVAQRLAIVATRDAIGKGVDEKVADRVRIGHAAGGGADLESTAPPRGRFLDSRERADVGRRGACTTGTGVAPEMQGRHALTEVVGPT